MKTKRSGNIILVSSAAGRLVSQASAAHEAGSVRGNGGKLVRMDESMI